MSINLTPFFRCEMGYGITETVLLHQRGEAEQLREFQTLANNRGTDCDAFFTV